MHVVLLQTPSPRAQFNFFQAYLSRFGMPQKFSKSRIFSGLQCVKRLHQEIHHPERPKVSETTEHIFVQGNKIGELVCR